MKLLHETQRQIDELHYHYINLDGNIFHKIMALSYTARKT